MAKKAIQEVAKYLLEELGGDYAATGTHLYGHLLKQLEEIS
jgi:hypothetical protein